MERVHAVGRFLCLALLSLFACLLHAPASAQQGTWKVEALYEGTGASAMGSAGERVSVSSTVGSLTLTPADSGFNLADVVNDPPDTFSGGITAKLPVRVFMEAEFDSSAHASQAVGSGTIRIKLTWQPKNGDALLDPPPAMVRFRYKRTLKVKTDLTVTSPEGGYADGRAKGELDSFVKDTQALQIPPPDPPASETSGLLEDGDSQMQEQMLPVSGGIASKTFSVKWTVSGSVIAPACDGGEGGEGVFLLGGQEFVPASPWPPIPLY